MMKKQGGGKTKSEKEISEDDMMEEEEGGEDEIEDMDEAPVDFDIKIERHREKQEYREQEIEEVTTAHAPTNVLKLFQKMYKERNSEHETIQRNNLEESKGDQEKGEDV